MLSREELQETYKKFIAKYDKLFESLNDKSVPNIIKQIIDDVKQTADFNNSFIKEYDYSTNPFFPIKFKLIYKLNKNISNNTQISYGSDVNILDVMTNIEVLDIYVNVSDLYVNYDKILAMIHHELRHVYDILTINDDDEMFSFMQIPVICRFRNKNEKYSYFIHLVYLSLQHELVARNSMIYHKLLNVDKDKLFDKFKETYIYKSLLQLKDFNVDKFIDKFNFNELLQITKEFIQDYKGYKDVNSLEDVREFYNL